MANRKAPTYTPEEQEMNAALARRDVTVKLVEHALGPYGMAQPYDRSLRIQQVKWLLRQEVEVRFSIGCILLQMREMECATFAQILSENFPEISKRTAYHYMLYAKKCMELPGLKAFAEDNWMKALTLLETCTDDELKEIEEKGINGKVLGEYDDMSAREFKQEIMELRKYKDKFDKTLQEKTAEVTKSLNAALKENEKLRALIEPPELPEEFSEVMDDLGKKTNEMVAICNRLDFGKAHKDAPNEGRIKAEYKKYIDAVERQFERVIESWRDAVLERG